MTISTPNVPLPAGVIEADDWEDGSPQPHRMLIGTYRDIAGYTGHSVTVVQWLDGSIDDGQIEPPHAVLLCGDEVQLNSAQLRELSSVLLAVANQIDGWTTR